MREGVSFGKYLPSELWPYLRNSGSNQHAKPLYKKQVNHFHELLRRINAEQLEMSHQRWECGYRAGSPAGANGSVGLNGAMLICVCVCVCVISRVNDPSENRLRSYSYGGWAPQSASEIHYHPLERLD